MKDFGGVSATTVNSAVRTGQTQDIENCKQLPLTPTPTVTVGIFLIGKTCILYPDVGFYRIQCQIAYYVVAFHVRICTVRRPGRETKLYTYMRTYFKIAVESNKVDVCNSAEYTVHDGVIGRSYNLYCCSKGVGSLYITTGCHFYVRLLHMRCERTNSQDQ